MSSTINNLTAATSLDGSEQVCIAKAGTNQKVSVDDLRGGVAKTPLVLYLYASSQEPIGQNDGYLDWVVESKHASNVASFNEMDIGVAVSVEGVYRVRLSTKFTALDEFYSTPQGLPLNIAVGTGINGGTPVLPNASQSCIALTGDAGTGYNETHTGQWTDEYLIDMTTEDLILPYVHWRVPGSSPSGLVNLTMLMTVEFMYPPVVIPE